MDKRRELLIKKLFGIVIFCSGFLHLYRWIKSLNKKQEVTILVYHRVQEYHEESNFDASIISASPKNFEEQMRFLSTNYNVISFDRFIEHIQNKTRLPEKSVVITFDDGYKDNYRNAYPILKKYGLPATVFLTTGYLDNITIPWWDKVAYIINETECTDFELTGFGRYSLKTDIQKVEAIHSIQEKLKKIKEEEKNLLIRKLEDILNVEIPEDLGRELFLSWDEVREMSKGGISFGAHTVTHPILTKVSTEKAKEEIVESKERIEKELGKPVKLFAYPNGEINDLNNHIKEILKDNGFTCAVLSIYGTNDLKSDPYELKRIRIDNFDTLPVFESKLLGIFGRIYNWFFKWNTQ